ncbi:fenitrothion hydrolase [Paraconexibacter algicola]|uniref:Fenitrothion hydrolase n=1 Tax=Paraconexibacter algicola TaxID=2133960 RepID=A0A2T4UHC5_9ACTN|nr:fenitrothion hydrolase [Paraconexibacter algicola]PTL58609.1 fenitrothion hydrolase [Paraconexibacter algicola]
MTRTPHRRTTLAALAAGALLILGPPAAAHAHGLVQRNDLPIPEWLFGWGAAVVLVVSFVALAVLWQQPRYERRGAASDAPTAWRPVPGPVGRALGAPALDTAAQVLGTFLFAVVLWAALAGTDTPQANLSPTFIFVVFWVGLVFASVLLGDVFHALNPWRAIGRATGWLLARARGGRLRAPRAYPQRLGRWPAAAGLLGFTWLELAESGGEHPRTLATATIVYSAITFAGMAVYGVRPWIRHGEAFSVYFGLFARLSPLEVRDGRLGTRRPLEGLTRLDVVPGTVGVVCVMIGTVTYDGLSSGSLWKDAQRLLDGLWEPLGLSVVTGLKASATVGLVVCVLLVAAFYRLGIVGMRSVGGGFDADRLSRAFVHTLVPIAVVYVAAHYLTLLAFQGQATVYLASDPLGQGWDLFGTATSTIDYWLGQNLAWYLQVGFVVLGHMAGLALAHDRALVLYGDARRAARSQYWMLSVMVGFTTLALWLLAQAGA